MRGHDPLKIFFFVVAVGAVTRLGVVWLYAARGQATFELPDEVQYWDMARSLAGGNGLQDELGYRATRMPLYPGFLALFVNLNNGRLLALTAQAILSALACGFIAALAFQLAPDPTKNLSQNFSIGGLARAEARGSLSFGIGSKTLAAIIAGLLVAVDPFLVYFCRLLLTESLLICAFCAFLAASWQTSQREQRSGLLRWLTSGTLLGLCVYLRPSSTGFFICWFLFVLFRRRFDKASLIGVCGSCLILFLLLSPWAARNRAATGKCIWLTTRLGISLYDGVHPQATGASSLGTIKDTAQGEIQWNEGFKTQAWKSIRTDPIRIIRLAGRKFIRTWNLWPNAEGYQSLSIKLTAGLWTLFVLASAVWGMRSYRGSRATILGLLLPALYFTALHMLFVGSVRYRLPAMPLIEIMSAVGITSILTKTSKAASSSKDASG